MDHSQQDDLPEGDYSQQKIYSADKDLQLAHGALKKLKECKFNERGSSKQKFADLYKVYTRFKHSIVESDTAPHPSLVLPRYLSLTYEITEFIFSPHFHNMFAEFDKKLMKNVIKRCIVEPFSLRIMSVQRRHIPGSSDTEKDCHEPRVYVGDLEIQKQVCDIFILLFKKDQNVTSSLKNQLAKPLSDYVAFLNSEEVPAAVKDGLDERVDEMKEIARKCTQLGLVFDYYHTDTVMNCFKNKQPYQMEKYIQVLAGLVEHAVEVVGQIDKKNFSHRRFNEKYIRQVFSGNEQSAGRLLKDNLLWIMKNPQYDFSKEQVLKVLQLTKENQHLMGINNNYQLRAKLDQALQKYISEMEIKFPDLKLSAEFGNIFFQKGDDHKSKVQKQIQDNKDKISHEQLVAKKGLNLEFFQASKLPDNIEAFFEQALERFLQADQPQFKRLDKEIGNLMRVVYKPKIGDGFSKAVFSYLDSYLGVKRTPSEAKNSKKLLAAVQKASVLHASEMAALFDKADRFISKQSIKKEKKEIMNEVRNRVMMDGVRGDAEQTASATAGAEPESKKKDEKATTEGSSSHKKEAAAPSTKTQTEAAGSSAKASKPDRLENYRAQVQAEQERKYLKVQESHQQIKRDFSSQKAQKRLHRIEELIKEVYSNQLVSPKDLEIRDQVINRIKDAFYKASHKDYPIKLTGEILIAGFGSCRNGSWNSEKSDIDVTAVFFDSLTHNHHQLIKMCSKVVNKLAKKGTLTYVPATRVPILKFIEDQSGMQVDFNVNNLLGITNSDLIYTYTQVDQRFHIMNIFLKWWAKSVGIIGAANGYLSSYALTLMIIAFLQSTEPPVLPMLQEKLLRDQRKQTVYYPVIIEELESKRRRRNYSTKDINKNVYCMSDTDAFFEKDLDVIKQFYMPKEENTKSVAQLIYEFFYFYVYEFDSANMVINIKEDGSDTIPPMDAEASPMKGIRHGFSQKFRKDRFPFSIVDPFEVQRNPGCSVKFHSLPHKTIMAQFRAVLDKFAEDED